MLRGVTRDLDPAAAPGVAVGDLRVGGHEAEAALLRVVDPLRAVARGDIDVQRAGAALHGLELVGLHEEEVVVLVRDDREVLDATDRLAGR